MLLTAYLNCHITTNSVVWSLINNFANLNDTGNAPNLSAKWLLLYYRITSAARLIESRWSQCWFISFKLRSLELAHHNDHWHIISLTICTTATKAANHARISSSHPMERNLSQPAWVTESRLLDAGFSLPFEYISQEMSIGLPSRWSIVWTLKKGNMQQTCGLT